MRVDKKEILAAAGYTIGLDSSDGVIPGAPVGGNLFPGWYALYPGETEYKEDPDTGKPIGNFIGYTSTEDKIVDKVYKEIKGKIMWLHQLSSDEFDGLSQTRKTELAAEMLTEVLIFKAVRSANPVIDIGDAVDMAGHAGAKSTAQNGIRFCKTSLVEFTRMLTGNNNVNLTLSTAQENGAKASGYAGIVFNRTNFEKYVRAIEAKSNISSTDNPDAFERRYSKPGR